MSSFLWEFVKQPCYTEPCGFHESDSGVSLKKCVYNALIKASEETQKESEKTQKESVKSRKESEEHQEALEEYQKSSEGHQQERD